MLFFNEDAAPATQSLSLRSLGIHRRGSTYLVKDLWSHERSEVADRLTAFVPGHGVAMFRVSAKRPPWPAEPHVALTNTTSETYVEAGRSATVTSTLVNDGRSALTRVSLGISAPAGWSVKPLSKPRSVVPGTGSTSASWRVTAPAGTAAGNYALAFTGRYGAAWRRQRTVRSERTLIVPPAPPTATSWLSDLTAAASSGTFYKDKQLIRTFGPSGPTEEERPLTLGGVTYAKGLGTVQGSEARYYVGGRCSRFTAVAGVDDNAGGFGGTTPSAQMQVIVDGSTVFDQTIAKGAPVTITQPLSGAKVLELVVAPSTGFGFGTAVDWAAAQVTCP